MNAEGYNNINVGGGRYASPSHPLPDSSSDSTKRIRSDNSRQHIDRRGNSNNTVDLLNMILLEMRFITNILQEEKKKNKDHIGAFGDYFLEAMRHLNKDDRLIIITIVSTLINDANAGKMKYKPYIEYPVLYTSRNSS